GITGRSADLREDFKSQKTRHFEDTTLGEVFGKIAGDHGLAPAIDPALASRRIAYVAQTEESDIHFMTRLARRFDALAKPANGRLVVVRHGDGRSGTGALLGAISLRPGDVTSVRASLADRPRHGTVEADWYDDDAAERRTVTVERGD